LDKERYAYASVSTVDFERLKKSIKGSGDGDEGGGSGCMSLAAIYYNYMRQLKSTLKILEPSIPQPQPQTAADVVIGTILKVRHDVIDAIVKKSRF